MGKTHRISYKALAFMVVSLVIVAGFVGFVQANSGFAGVLVAQDDTANHNRYIQERTQNIKDYTRELTEIKKLSKTVNTTTVDGLLSQFTSCIQARQLEVGTQDFWNNVNSTCNDLQNSINDEMTVFRLLKDCAQSSKNIQDRKKEKKSNIDRQFKDIQRNAKGATIDLTAVTTLISQIDAEFVKADLLLAGACTEDCRDAIRDIETNLNDYFRDAYDTMNELNNVANQARQLVDNTRDYEKDKKARCEKDKARELKNLEKEMARAGKKMTVSQEEYTTVKGIYDQMCTTALGAMKAALDAKDMDAYNSASTDFNDLDRTFWETLNEVRQGVNEKMQKVEQVESATKELKQWSKELMKMKSELNKAKKTYSAAAKRYANVEDRKEALVAFADYVSQAETLIKQIETSVATAASEVPNDPDSWWYERQEELNDMRDQFNEMQGQVQMIGQVLKGLKQVESGLKAAVKERAKVAKATKNNVELMAALDAIIANANATYKEAWSLAISAPEDAMSLIQSLQSVGQDWNDTIEEWKSSQSSASTGQ
jgi:hypothetical protein